MNVTIVEGCIVCRQCECQAPDVFRVHERAHTAKVVQADPPMRREQAVIEAIKGCPVNVIRLKRDPKPVREQRMAEEACPASRSRLFEKRRAAAAG
jgi:ferredoxin